MRQQWRVKLNILLLLARREMEFIKRHLFRKSPTKIKDIQVLEIAIVALKFNPSKLTVNYFQSQNIVPSQWQLNSQPINSANKSQINFKNGVKILAIPQEVTFSQNISNNQSNVPEIASKYVKNNSEINYQKVNIMFKRVVSLPGSTDQARKYIKEHLLVNGPWLEFGNSVGAGINFFYELERCQLNLSINEATIKEQKKISSPALFFSSNFNYNLSNYCQYEKLLMLGKIINNWQQDLTTFTEIVNQSF